MLANSDRRVKKLFSELLQMIKLNFSISLTLKLVKRRDETSTNVFLRCLQPFPDGFLTRFSDNSLVQPFSYCLLMQKQNWKQQLGSPTRTQSFKWLNQDLVFKEFKIIAKCSGSKLISNFKLPIVGITLFKKLDQYGVIGVAFCWLKSLHEKS